MFVPSGFQSTLPHGERHELQKQQAEERLFQSTLPHGERPPSVCRIPVTSGFNPRSRTGSDRLYFGGRIRILLFQSTLPHGERRQLQSEYDKLYEVSIHAPARRATFGVPVDEFFDRVSIHAPARGATGQISDK